MLNKKEDLDLIKYLTKIISISGKEYVMAQFIDDIANSLADKVDVSIDKFNNVTLKINGESDDVIMLDAHLDQIGFVISGISKEGMLSCYRIGGCSLGATEAREFVVITDNTVIPCIANKKHMHLINDEKKDLPEHTYDVVFDIGCKSKEEAEKLVEIGDYIGYKPTFGELQNNLIYGTALDDKIGCFMLLKIFESVSNTKAIPKKSLIFSFTAQEETGVNRLKHLVKKHKPAKLIEFDVTFASDYDSVKPKEVGECNLGDGIVLYVGNLTDIEVKNKLNTYSKELNCKLQKQVLNGAGGYNSDAVYKLGEDADVTVIGIPLRNMHSPVEICSMVDVYSGIELITKLVMEL